MALSRCIIWLTGVLYLYCSSYGLLGVAVQCQYALSDLHIEAGHYFSFHFPIFLHPSYFLCSRFSHFVVRLFFPHFSSSLILSPPLFCCTCCTSYSCVPGLYLLQTRVSLRVVTSEMIHHSQWCDTWTTFVILWRYAIRGHVSLIGCANCSWWATWSGVSNCSECFEETLMALRRLPRVRTEMLFFRCGFAACLLIWELGYE